MARYLKAGRKGSGGDWKLSRVTQGGPGAAQGDLTVINQPGNWSITDQANSHQGGDCPTNGQNRQIEPSDLHLLKLKSFLSAKNVFSWKSCQKSDFLNQKIYLLHSCPIPCLRSFGQILLPSVCWGSFVVRHQARLWQRQRHSYLRNRHFLLERNHKLIWWFHFNAYSLAILYVDNVHWTLVKWKL